MVLTVGCSRVLAQVGGARADSRGARQLRALQCERAPLGRADGSARWEQAGTAVLAAVHGPRVPSTASQREGLRCEVEVVWRPLCGAPGARERHREHLLREALQGAVLAGLHPRTAVTVVVQVLQDAGSLWACALNAAGAALVDAGVPLVGVLAGVACAVPRGGGALLLDPSAAEEAEADGLVQMAFAFQRGLEGAGGEGTGAGDRAAAAEGGEDGVSAGALTLETVGAVPLERTLEALALGRRGALQVAAFTRLSAERHFAPLLTVPR